MAREEQSQKGRKSPYIEPWPNRPYRKHRKVSTQECSRASTCEDGFTRSADLAQKNETPEILQHDSFEDPATFSEGSWAYPRQGTIQQWQEGYFRPQSGSWAHNNTSGPCFDPSYGATSAISGGYPGTRFTGRDLSSPHWPRYPRAQILGAETSAEHYHEQSNPTAYLPPAYSSEASDLEAYEPEASQSARRVQHDNPFLPQPRASTHLSQDL